MSTVTKIKSLVSNFFDDDLKTSDIELFNSIKKEFNRLGFRG